MRSASPSATPLSRNLFHSFLLIVGSEWCFYRFAVRRCMIKSYKQPRPPAPWKSPGDVLSLPATGAGPGRTASRVSRPRPDPVPSIPLTRRAGTPPGPVLAEPHASHRQPTHQVHPRGPLAQGGPCGPAPHQEGGGACPRRPGGGATDPPWPGRPRPPHHRPLLHP